VVAAALLFAACGLVWLIGQVAAIVFGAHEHLPVRLVVSTTADPLAHQSQAAVAD
jgi:hypothetical protein